MTKNVVRKHLSSAQPPEYLIARIKDEIRRERSARGAQSTTPAFRRRPVLTALFALGGVGAIAVLLVMLTPSAPPRHTHKQPADGNVVHQIYNNFDAVLNGSIRPEIVTDDPQKIVAFFRPMVDFDVKVPTMHSFKLVGAMCSQYDGKCIAQLVYRGSKDIVYLCEVRMCLGPQNESGFQVPPEAFAQLQGSKWYFENHAPDCSLAMWMVDSTLCCAVADINKDVLFASLTESR